ncbi:MAG: MFS transporter [Chloroflexota bacterium]|nr:MFS transporter [Chloroflexota bacterium]MYC06390.1 MFS transporter [Chloroflexota bacterium]
MAQQPQPSESRARLNYGRVIYPHYVWVIVTVIAVMQMVGTSIRMAFGVFIDPLEQTFNWSQGSITFAYLLSSVVTALASPFAGWFGDRFGARKAMVIGTAMFLAGMLLTGLISTIWELYLYFGVLLGVAQAIFLVPLIPSAMNWFRRHLGVGMGLIMASWGIGPAIAALVVGWLIDGMGWQNAFIALGVGSAAIMFLLIGLFRDRPADKGLQPYGFRPGDVEVQKRRPDPERTKLFSGYMRKTAAFWNMSSIHFLGCVGHAIILVYIVPLAVNEGLTLLQATGVLSTLSAVSVISRVFVPIMCETIGTRKIMFVFFALQGILVLMLFWTHDVWMFYLFAIVFGIGYGGETGGFPILNRQYYGQAPTGAPHGWQMAGAGLGMALGGWIGGPIFDIFGSYDIALWASIATSLAGALNIVFLEPTHSLLIPDWEAEEASESEESPDPEESPQPRIASGD